MIAKINGAKDKRRYQILRVLIATVIIIASMGTTFAAAANIITSYIYCDKEMIKVVSLSDDVDDIINKANITLNENDLVDISNYVPGENDGVIYIYRACEVTVTDGKNHSFVNTAGTVGGALEKAGVVLQTGDTVNYDLNLYVFEGMKIVVNRAFGVTVIADGESKSFKVSKGTVADILEEAGVTLGKNDKVNHSLDKKVKEGMKIVVKRVTYSKHKETETLSFSTKTIQDSSMYKDQSQVIQQGKDGIKEVTYKDKYVDGELTKSTVSKTKVIQKAQEKIVKVGTMARPVVKVSGTTTISTIAPPSSLKLDENGRPTEYKKLITGKGTAYSCGTTCSTGVKVKPGYVAVNPKQIPYGTKMYIVSSDGKWVYGYAIAADTGGFATNCSGTIVDLNMTSESQCINFGRRNVEIYILD